MLIIASHAIGRDTTSGDTAIPRVPARSPHRLRHGPMSTAIRWSSARTGTQLRAVTRRATTRTHDRDERHHRRMGLRLSLIGCVDPGEADILWVNGILTQVTHDPRHERQPGAHREGVTARLESRGDLGERDAPGRSSSQQGRAHHAGEPGGREQRKHLPRRTGSTLCSTRPAIRRRGLRHRADLVQPRGGIPTGSPPARLRAEVGHQPRRPVIAFEAGSADRRWPRDDRQQISPTRW